MEQSTRLITLGKANMNKLFAAKNPLQHDLMHPASAQPKDANAVIAMNPGAPPTTNRARNIVDGSSGMALLFVDESWSSMNLNRMGIGAIVCDLRCNWLSGSSSSSVHGNVFLAELLAVENGLHHVSNFSYKEVLCFLDWMMLFMSLLTI